MKRLATVVIVLTAAAAGCLDFADAAPAPKRAACDAACQFETVTHDIAARDGVTVDVAAQRLALLLAPRYHHPNPLVDRWYPQAMTAGWPDASWQWLSCVINRESNGNPNAWNRRDPGQGSASLLQINSVNVGWLRNRGIVATFSDLFEPWANLRAGWELYQSYGPGPWRAQRGRC